MATLNCSFKYKDRSYSSEGILRKLTQELPNRNQDDSIKWLKEYLNIDDNEVDIVLGLIDNKSLGRFQRDGSFLLSSLATEATTYHEAFHRVFRMYLSPEQRIEMYKDVKRRPNYKSLIAKYANDYQSEESQIEEFLADEFSDYVLNPESFKSNDLTFFQKLIKFLKSIVGIKDNTVLYDRILSKEFTYTPRYNPYDSADQVLISGTTFTVEQKQEVIGSFLQRLLSNVLNQGIDITDFLTSKSDNLELMIQATKDQLVDDMENDYPDQALAVLEDLESGENSDIWKGVLRMLDMIGITVNQEESLVQEQTKDPEVSEDGFEDSMDEESKASREFSVSFETDPKSSMSIKLKLILASLTDGETTNYKFKKPVSWTKAFNTVATRMAGVPTEEFRNELRALDLNYKTDLINILDKNFQFGNKFISEMSKTINEFYIYKLDKGEAYLFSANANTRTEKIVRDWKNNLIKNSQQLFGTKNWSEEMQRLINKGPIRILNHLGITVDSRVEDLSIADSMTTAMNRKKYAIDPANPFVSLDIEGYVKQLASKQAEYEEQVDLMARVADKKLYTLGLNTQQTILLNGIAYAQSKFTKDMTDEQKVEILKKYAEFAASEFNLSKINGKIVVNNKWLERILAGEKLKVVIASSMENSTDERTVDELTEPDLMSLHITGALQGLTMSMKHSDRSTFFAYTFGNNPLYGLADASSEQDLLDKLTNDILRVIENEVKVTKFMQDNKVAVQYLGTKDLKSGFAGMVSNPENPSATDIAKIGTIVKNKFNEYVDKIKELGLVSDDLSKTPGLNKEIITKYGNVRLALASAFVNETSSHIYESMLFSGDLRAFKNADDLFKRLAPQSSTGQMMVTDDLTHDRIKQELDVDHEIYNPLTGKTEVINAKNTFHGDMGKFRSITLLEREDYKSKLMEPAISNGQPLISKLTGNQESVIFMIYEDNFLKDTQFREANTDKQIEDKIRLYEKKYSTANENDGQSYMSLPAFKQYQMRLGDWTDGFELVYRIEMELAKYSNLNDAKDITITFKGQTFKPFDLSNSNFKERTLGRKTIKLEPIHTLKTQFAGYSVPENLQADVDYAFNSVYKTSQHVLLPSAIIGTNLQLMNVSMLTNGLDIIHMGSANKVGGVDPKMAANKYKDLYADRKYINDIAERGLDFYSKEGIFNHEAITENLDITSYLSDWKYLKDQVRIGNKTKKEIKGSTQSLKILLSNLIINGEERFPGAEQLVELYKQVVKESVSNNRDDLFEEIGYVDGEFESLDQLRDVILNSTQVKNSADNVKNSIINFFANPELGLETVPLKNKIEYVLYSLITKNIISFDRSGSSYPQAASTGYEPYGSRVSDASNDDAVKFYTFEFDENGVSKVNPAEIIIPLPMDWIKPLMKWAKTNNLIEAIDKLNKEISIRPDDFQVKGLRIPNQQLSSNDWFQIKKFNLPTMQNYVIVPTEHVIKTGGDFDIDSTKTYWGSMVKKIFNLELKPTLDDQLLSLEKQILLHPRNAHNLLLPVTDEIFVKGTFEELKKAGQIETTSPEMINAVLPQVNVAKSIIFVKGKKMVGPGALTITGNAVKQADKFGEINPIYGIKEEPLTTKLRFAGLEQMFRVDNAVTSNGGQISEVLSQLLSISVDNVKNPVAELQNINMQTISVVSYLIERGVDEKRIIQFINQPIIKKYLTAQKANESLFNKEAGNELSKDELIKKVINDLGYEGEMVPELSDEWIFENNDYRFTPNQFFVLTYFLELIEQSRLYGAFNSTQNSDTKGLKDKQALDEANIRLDAMYPQDSIPLIPIKTVTRVNTNGVIAPFYQYGRESYKIFNEFYAIEDSIFGEALLNLKNNYAEYEKGVNKDRIRQSIENDFQLFLIHNFVLDNDFDRLMKGKDSLPNRMLDLKNKLPDNLIMQAFLPMINFTKDVNTGELISGLRLFEKELQALDEQALSISIEEIANEDLELYKDLVKFLMYQTGLNLSPFNYSKILPVGLESERFNTPDYMYVYQDMIQSGLAEMNRQIQTKKQATVFLEQFKILFDLNNPKFIKKSTYSGHPIKVKWNKSETGFTPQYTDSNDKPVQLLGNAYQKRYNLSYIGVQNSVTPETIELFNTESNVPVVKNEDTNYTFEYKGVSIGTEFKLGDQQEKALKELIEHVESGKQTAMTLSGSAGTGKTTIIGYLQKYFQEKKKRMSFIYMAPTHAATAELAFSTVKTGNNTLPATVQSSIYMNPALNLPEYTAKIKDRVLGFPVFVVDESSMLDIADINNLVTATERIGGKLIFLGDKMQIPKVTTDNSKSKPLSPAFTNFEQVELTKVFRQKESGLLTLLDNIRNQSEFIPLKASNSSALEFTNNTKFKEELFDKIESDPENTKVISYTNASVKSMNNIIRKALGKPNNTEKGDVIIGYLGYGNKQIEKSNLANSISYTIQDYKQSGSTIQIVANSGKLESLIETGIKGIKPETEFTYLQLDSNDSLQFKELNQTDFNNNNQYLSSIFEKIDSLNQQMKRKEIHYMTYVTEIRGITDPLAKLSVGDSYVYNPSTKKMEKYDSIKHKNIKTNGVGSLLFEKDVDYGYAITIHKSQGTTINNVFFLADSINSAQDTKVVDSTGNQITTEKNALYYVAMSRGRNRLVVDQGSLNYKTIETSVDMETPEIKIQESISNPEFMEEDVSMLDLTGVEFTDFEGNIVTNVDQIKKNEPTIELDTLYQEILNNWNTYFPNEAYFTDEEKMNTIRLIQSGELTLICNF